MPYGRGGAGNMQQMAEGAKRMTEMQDIEKLAKPPTDAEREQRDAPTNPGGDYAHMGRGGAGNWYEPKTLAAQGQFTSSAGEATASPAAGGERPSESRKMGRGGAGNFVWEDEGKKEGEARELEERVHGDVLKDVEAGLPKPGKAFLKAEVLKE